MHARMTLPMTRLLETRRPAPLLTVVSRSHFKVVLVRAMPVRTVLGLMKTPTLLPARCPGARTHSKPLSALWPSF